MRSNTNAFGTSNSCTTSASQTDFNGEYRLTNSNIVCALMIRTE